MDWACSRMVKESARAFFSLTGLVLEEPRETRSIQLSATDPESLLVAFLSELLYLAEQEQLGFDPFNLTVTELTLDAILEGARSFANRKKSRRSPITTLLSAEMNTG